MVWFRWGCTASCGWNVRCVGVRGDAWSVLLSPCNTKKSATRRQQHSELSPVIYGARINHDNGVRLLSTEVLEIPTFNFKPAANYAKHVAVLKPTRRTCNARDVYIYLCRDVFIIFNYGNAAEILWEEALI